MPRIDALRFARLVWLAWTVDDLGKKGPVRYGWSEQHARDRAARTTW